MHQDCLYCKRRNIILSSPKDVVPKDAIEITEEDIIRAELKTDNPSRAALEKYEQDARKLAKAIAMALPEIQPALYKAMVLSSDEREHKVRLASFVNSTVNSQICATGYIENTELHRILKTYSDRLYIYIPDIVGGWTTAASKVGVVVAAPPHDEKDIDALGLKVYGYNTKGEELTFDPWIAPDYPTFSITPEAPFENSASLLGTPDRSLKGGENAKAYPRIYWINVHCSKYDPWPFTGLEIYVVMCHYYYPSGGDATERTNLTDVDHPNKTYGVGEWIAVQRDIWDPYEEPVLDTAQYQQDSFDYLKVMEEDWGGGDDWIGTKNFVQPYWAPGGMTSPEYGGGGYYQCDGPGDDFAEVRLWTKVVEF